MGSPTFSTKPPVLLSLPWLPRRLGIGMVMEAVVDLAAVADDRTPVGAEAVVMTADRDAWTDAAVSDMDREVGPPAAEEARREVAGPEGEDEAGRVPRVAPPRRDESKPKKLKVWRGWEDIVRRSEVLCVGYFAMASLDVLFSSALKGSVCC